MLPTVQTNMTQEEWWPIRDSWKYDMSFLFSLILIVNYNMSSKSYLYNRCLLDSKLGVRITNVAESVVLQMTSKLLKISRLSWHQPAFILPHFLQEETLLWKWHNVKHEKQSYLKWKICKTALACNSFNFQGNISLVSFLHIYKIAVAVGKVGWYGFSKTLRH